MDAMDQWRASKRRAIRPVLVFVPLILLALVLPNEAAGVTLSLGAMTIGYVMIWQNFVVVRRAERRLKAEKMAWEAKQPQPPGQPWGPRWRAED